MENITNPSPQVGICMADGIRIQMPSGEKIYIYTTLCGNKPHSETVNDAFMLFVKDADGRLNTQFVKGNKVYEVAIGYYDGGESTRLKCKCGGTEFYKLSEDIAVCCQCVETRQSVGSYDHFEWKQLPL